MDHIPLPTDSFSHLPWQVPFLSSQRRTYDDQGFFSFPKRAAVDTSQLHKLEELASFLQEWLWFGLLGETIGVGSLPQCIASRAAFITKSADGTEIITSGELRRCVLLAGTKNQSPTFDDLHLTKYELCIGHALEIVNEVLSRWASTPDFMSSNLHFVLFSVQVLCETLLAAREILFPSHRLRLTPMSSFLRSQVTHPVDIFLLGASWCWSDIHRLPKQVVLRYYLSFMNPSSNRHNHSACSAQRCILPPVPDHTLRPVHTSEDCECEEIAIDDDTLIRIIEQGKVPLLTFSEQSGGKRRLAVLEHSLSTVPTFTAISHVRHLGLGSSTSNALPYCQLSRLQTLATDDRGIMPFWIDTICVPVPRKARKAALLNASHIFTAASTVLVLDPCLHRHVIGSATDALLRIKHSSWAKRLWTIQEGALAKKLCFQFLNGVRSLDDLVSEYEEERAQDVLHLLPSKRVDYGRADDSMLTQLLGRLHRDLTAVESVLVGEGEKPNDRFKLRTMLRWGYLASPRFYWMVDESEMWRLRAVADVLEQVYAVEGETNSGVLDRLRCISAVDLKFEQGSS